jgi:PAS domain S-box-containing protein
VPLVKQAKLIGVLYLENSLASYVFTPARISVLEMLASQAAISLENARLYNDLQEREARIRRLVDSNIIGILIFNFQGQIIDANQAFLDIVGYAREDLASGRLRWRELTPAEWRAADDRALAELKVAGTIRPREKEYFRKDGSRVPVLLGSTTFGDRQDEGVTFVLDLTERNRAVERLRASEQRLLDAQMELAHVTRITALGELAASIAHEVNQPLAAVVEKRNQIVNFVWRGNVRITRFRRRDCRRNEVKPEQALYGVCQEVFLAQRIFSASSVSLFDLKARFFVPTRALLTAARAGAVKVGRRTNLSACSALARPYLDGSEHDGTLDAMGTTIRGKLAMGREIIAPQPCIR